jgi:hypothetical protein
MGATQSHERPSSTEPAPAPSSEPNIGEGAALIAERYRLLARLHAGTGGVLYRAEDVAFARPVAVRMLTPTLSRDETVLERLRARLEASASMARDDIEASGDILDLIDLGRAENGQVFVVTELLTGMDLVKEQIRVAAGMPLSKTQGQVVLFGHAIEARINAEDPQTFAPSPGLVTDFHAAGGPGVRIDSALYSGYRVPPTYDSLVAKLIVHADTREEAIMRMKRALEEMVVSGIKTTIPLHQRLMDEPDFRSGDYSIKWLEALLAKGGRG